MKKFLYIRHSKSTCDNSADCGISVSYIVADSKEEAIKKVIGLLDTWKEDLQEANNLDDYYNEVLRQTAMKDVVPDPHLPRITIARLIEITDEIDMMPVLKVKFFELESFKFELESKKKDDADRAVYEHLKKKFEK